MGAKIELTLEQQRSLGIDLNNATWRLLERQGRSPIDDELMVHAAHASAYHWSIGGTGLNAIRADWLISHVYAVLGRPQQAVHYAELCYQGTQEFDATDFDLAYAEEAMARAHACSGDSAQAQNYFVRAKEAGEAIVDPEDRKIFESDFRAGPWFGLAGSAE